MRAGAARLVFWGRRSDTASARTPRHPAPPPPPPPNKRHPPQTNPPLPQVQAAEGHGGVHKGALGIIDAAAMGGGGMWRGGWGAGLKGGAGPVLHWASNDAAAMGGDGRGRGVGKVRGGVQGRAGDSGGADIPAAAAARLRPRLRPAPAGPTPGRHPAVARCPFTRQSLR
jgi:hypothetical protein